MQKNNLNTSTKVLDPSKKSSDKMHEYFSCEKLKSIADEHSELCMGLYASIAGGASLDDVSKLVSRIVDQSETISMHATMMEHIEKEGEQLLSSVS